MFFFICLVGYLLLFNLPLGSSYLDWKISPLFDTVDIPLCLFHLLGQDWVVGVGNVVGATLGCYLGAGLRSQEVASSSSCFGSSCFLALFRLTLPTHPYVFFSLGEARPLGSYSSAWKANLLTLWMFENFFSLFQNRLFNSIENSILSNFLEF